MGIRKAYGPEERGACRRIQVRKDSILSRKKTE
jgi:hypothetical protein